MPDKPSPTGVAWTQTALLAAIIQANANGGGTITFNCRATTIPMTAGLGTIQDGVVLDGEDRRITLSTRDFTGCRPRAMASSSRDRSPQRSQQHGQEPDIQALSGIPADHRPGQRRREETSFWRIPVRTTRQHDHLQIRNATIRKNRAQDYRDKAHQMS